jgi:hypothetical protein
MADATWKMRGLPLSRLVAEFLVVVLGVVVGLAVDSAREAKADSGHAIEYLTRIADDLAASERLMTEQIVTNDTVMEHGLLLLDGLNRRSLPPPDSLRGWWAPLFHSASYRATTPTIDALVAGGDTGLLTDSELKRAILQYRDAVGLVNTRTQLADESTDRALEGMAEDVSLDNIDSSRSELRLPIDWEAAAESHWFHSQVQTVVSMSRIRALELRDLRETARELRILIGPTLSQR